MKEVCTEARKEITHFNFSNVFMTMKKPGYRVKEIGNTMSGRKETEEPMTPPPQKFNIGDYLGIVITPLN